MRKLALMACLLAGNATAVEIELPATLTAATHYDGALRGTVDIEPDGRVSAVAFEREDATSNAMKAAVMAWAFEPVRDDAGQPIRARAHVYLDLYARVRDEESLELGVDHVWFTDPPQADGTPGASASSHLTPPRYPVDALRAGFSAAVTLMLRLRADGSVERAAVSGLSVYQRSLKANPATRSYLREVSEAALQAARRWQFPAALVAESRTVSVPVKFMASPLSDAAWIPLIPVTVTPEPWMLLETAPPQQLSASGERPSERFRLLTDVGGKPLN